MTTLEGVRRQTLVFWRDILQEEVQITSKKSLFETSVLTNYEKLIIRQRGTQRQQIGFAT